MICALIRKEWRQHGMTLGFIVLFVVSSVVLLKTNRFLRQVQGSPLAALQLQLVAFAPFASLILGHVLIATEFRHKTQLFLESLPLPRWRMIAIKYALGLLVLVGGVTAATAIACCVRAAPEAFTPRFLSIVACKGVGWIWFIYSLFFAYAFLGRYRLMFAVAAGIGLAVLAQENVAISDFPPLTLVDKRFAFERHEFPVRELAVTAGLSAGLMAASLLLGTSRDATVAAMLSERMSAREKGALTLLLFVACLGFATLKDARKHRAPVWVPGSFDVDRDHAHVSASAAVDAPRAEEQAAVRDVAERVADDLNALATFLHCEWMPHVFIVHRRDFRGDQFEKGDLQPRQGLMVRTNLTAPGFREEALRTWIIREALAAKSGGRLSLERHAWVLDGFPGWWLHHASGDDAAIRQWPEYAAAVKAAPPDFGHASLQQWFRVRKAAGETESRSLAACGLGVFQEKHGPEACERFFSAMLGPDLPHDARGWFYDLTHPIGRRFRRAAGVPLQVFAEEWRAALVQPADAP